MYLKIVVSLMSFGVSVDFSSTRTKHKAKPNSYRAESVGLNITINLKDGKTLVLPIEVQIQSKMQEEDGRTGWSAHCNKEGKKVSLRPIPKIRPGAKYTSQETLVSDIKEYIYYSEHIQETVPVCAKARLVGKRVIIERQDLYSSLAQICEEVEKGSVEEGITNAHLRKLYKVRRLLLSSEASLPSCYHLEDIPQRRDDPFFEELAESVTKTMKVTVRRKKDSNGENNGGRNATTTQDDSKPRTLSGEDASIKKAKVKVRDANQISFRGVSKEEHELEL